MKLRRITVFLLAAALLPWLEGPRTYGATPGAVIYKEFSFDPDSRAEMTVYTSVERFGTVDNVHTPRGETLRIFSNQDPVYIPGAGDPQSDPAEAASQIAAAERRFPQFTSSLEVYRSAWAAVAKTAPAAEPSHPVAAASTPSPTPASASASPTASAARVLRTVSGQTYSNWSLSGVEGNYVIISHDDGISRVPISDLPNNLIGFPPEVAARALLLKEESDAEAHAELMKAVNHASPSPSPRLRALPTP